MCTLLRQVISPKKKVISSAKFTNLISWSPIYIPLILLWTQSLMLYLMLTFLATLNLVQSIGERLNEWEYNLDER